MGKKSIKKNYIYNLCYQILLIIVPIVTTPYVSRVIGADGIGVASYATSIVTYFTLFTTLGTTTFGQREISYLQDSRIMRSKMFWEIKILGLFLGGLILSLYIVFIHSQQNKIIYIILTLNILAAVFDITWFFQGLEEFSKIVYRNVIFKIINIVFIFVFVKSKNSLNCYIFGSSFLVLLSNLSLWMYLPKFLVKVKISRLQPFKHFRVILSLFLPALAIQIYTVLDKTMIGFITKDSFENGYYEQAIKLSKIVLTVVTALGVVMVPRIGYYFERKDYESLKKLVYRGYRFVFFLGIPLCFGLIIVSNNFIPWFFGEGFDKVGTLLHILSFIIIAIGVSNVTGVQYLIPTKRQNIVTITVVIGACINFCMNLILIPLYQSVGAAIASVSAEIIISILQLYLVRKEISLFRVIKEGINYWFSGFIMAFVLWIESLYFPSTILYTLIMVYSGGGIYILVLFIVKDELLLSNVKIILDRIRKH